MSDATSAGGATADHSNSPSDVGEDGANPSSGGEDASPEASGAASSAVPAPDGEGLLEPLTSGVRFGKFVSVGAVGAVFDNAVLVALRLGAGLPELWAKAAGIETAILVMFLANERWTFADEGTPGRGPVLRRLGRSHLVRSGGVTVQLVVYWVLVEHLAVTLVAFGTDWWFLAASPVAIGVGMVVNYVAESLFTWRVHR